MSGAYALRSSGGDDDVVVAVADGDVKWSRNDDCYKCTLVVVEDHLHRLGSSPVVGQYWWYLASIPRGSSFVVADAMTAVDTFAVVDSPCHRDCLRDSGTSSSQEATSIR